MRKLSGASRLRWMMTVLGFTTAVVAWATPTAQWVSNLTPTAVTAATYGGALVQITMSVPAVTGCTYTDFYAVRDPDTMKGALALATTAIVAGRQLDVYVTGACDTGGRPLVNSVNLH